MANVGENNNFLEKYRQLQLQSVTGYDGTSEWEILKVTSWLIFATLLLNCLFSHHHHRSEGWQVILEFIIMIVPQVVLFCFPQFTQFLVISCFIPCLFYHLFNRRPGASPVTSAKQLSSGRTASMANIRSAVMLMCVIGILAVDFTIFPRRFVKTENFGTSLMDVGVGCVIVSMGLTAGRSLSKLQPSQRPSLWHTVKSTVPLLILGCLRTVLVKLLDYQEHVSEYGIHWNFFLTLGLLPLLSWTTFSWISPRWSLPVGLFIAIVYQCLLRVTTLEAFALSNDLRRTLFEQNKEGLISLTGAFALFLMSIGCAKTLQCTKQSIYSLAGHITVLGSCYAFLKWMTALEASRRLMNLPFILGTLTLTLIQSLGFILLECLLPTAPTILLANAISENQLAFFLLANLLTGVINVTCYTLLQPPSLALGIIFAYMFVLCTLVTLLYVSRIKLRF